MSRWDCTEEGSLCISVGEIVPNIVQSILIIIYFLLTSSLLFEKCTNLGNDGFKVYPGDVRVIF